ncbi:hypothetical protein INR49_006957 [Caranx melampygus]|nr:hypothetical protein INR49_006957 [Caranx melampygus]
MWTLGYQQEAKPSDSKYDDVLVWLFPSGRLRLRPVENLAERCETVSTSVETICLNGEDVCDLTTYMYTLYTCLCNGCSTE